jgi:hypothetical protein
MRGMGFMTRTNPGKEVVRHQSDIKTAALLLARISS